MDEDRERRYRLRYNHWLTCRTAQWRSFFVSRLVPILCIFSCVMNWFCVDNQKQHPVYRTKMSRETLVLFFRSNNCECPRWLALAHWWLITKPISGHCQSPLVDRYFPEIAAATTFSVKWEKKDGRTSWLSIGHLKISGAWVALWLVKWQYWLWAWWLCRDRVWHYLALPGADLWLFNPFWHQLVSS